MNRQQMESLEVRALLSANLVNGELIVNGTEAADVILIDNASTRNLAVHVGTEVSLFRASAVKHITINALGGDDHVDVQVTKPATINGGDGIDTLIGSSAADLIVGGKGNDVLFGNKGNDAFTWDPGEGSDFVEGGKGFDTLIFNGSDGDEIMDASANGNRLKFFRNLGNITIDAGTTEKLTVVAKGGNDQITINNLTGTPVTNVVVDGGAGNDTINGGNLAEILLGGAGNDSIDGNGGNDSMFGDAGDDLLIWDPGDGSDLDIGGDGNDVLRFNGSNGDEIMEATSTAKFARTIFTRNVGNIVLDVRSTETIDVNAKGGADKITVNDQAAGVVRKVNINLESATGSAVADDKADSVIVNGTRRGNALTVTGQVGGPVTVAGLLATVAITNASATQDGLTVNALSGDDVIDAKGLVKDVLANLTLDGDVGNDAIAGSGGIDALLGGEGNDSVDGNQGNDVALLGNGDDLFTWDPGDGSDVVEGQAGTDTLRFNGSAGAENFTLSPNGNRFTFFRNVGNITMDMAGTEKVNLFGLAGDDSIVVGNLTGTGLAQFFADGGDGIDTLDLKNDAGVQVTQANVENVLQ